MLQFFPQLLSLAQQLLRGTAPPVAVAGAELYQLLFRHFSAAYNQQEASAGVGPNPWASMPCPCRAALPLPPTLHPSAARPPAPGAARAARAPGRAGGGGDHSRAGRAACAGAGAHRGSGRLRRLSDQHSGLRGWLHGCASAPGGAAPAAWQFVGSQAAACGCVEGRLRPCTAHLDAMRPCVPTLMRATTRRCLPSLASWWRARAGRPTRAAPATRAAAGAWSCGCSRRFSVVLAE